MVDGACFELWVVTGPIAGGKSTVSKALSDLGASVIDADAVGHAVLEEPEIINQLTQQYGSGILVDGCVDRSALGAIVFADSAQLTRLEAITHPRLSELIRERLVEERMANPRPLLAVVEAAVYFRLPSFGVVDQVILVTATEDRRRERLIAAGKCNDQQAQQRIEAQRPLLKDWEQSDIVLQNNDDLDELNHSVRELWSSLMDRSNR
jgi:dephospho-CoA kinase